MASSNKRQRSEFDDEKFFEIVDGERVQMPVMSVLACRTTGKVLHAVETFAQEHEIGLTLLHSLFLLPLPDDPTRARRPDVALLTYTRWPRTRPLPHAEGVPGVLPDLAVEVASPSETPVYVWRKLTDYIRGGVKEVWIVYPPSKVIHVFDSLKVPKSLTAADRFEGSKVLPGFHVPVSLLFPPKRHLARRPRPCTITRLTLRSITHRQMQGYRTWSNAARS